MYGIDQKVPGLNVEDTPDAGRVRTTVFRFSDCAIPLIDNAGVCAYLSKKIYQFPEGNNLLKTIKVDLAVGKTSAGVNNDYDGDFALGTTANAGDASMATTEVDVVASTATGQAVNGVGTAKFVNTAVIFQDGTGGAKSLYLNYNVDDGDQDVTTTPASLVFNGTIEIQWEIGGDK